MKARIDPLSLPATMVFIAAAEIDQVTILTAVIWDDWWLIVIVPGIVILPSFCPPSTEGINIIFIVTISHRWSILITAINLVYFSGGNGAHAWLVVSCLASIRACEYVVHTYVSCSMELIILFGPALLFAFESSMVLSFLLGVGTILAGAIVANPATTTYSVTTCQASCKRL